MAKVFPERFPVTDDKSGRRSPGLYISDFLKHQLDIAKRALKKDWDMVFVIDGPEGSGKSTLAIQVGYYLDPTLIIDRITFTPNEFHDAVIKAKKYECIIFDEAFGGLSSRRAMSGVNHMLISMLAEIRQKNLVIILVLPSFFDLDRFAALHRTRCLLHVYSQKFKRGAFKFYDYNKKKKLYLIGKKTYNYAVVKSNFLGRFTAFMPIDKEAYRAKKLKSLEDRQDTGEKERMERGDIRLKYERIKIMERLSRRGVDNKTIAEVLDVSDSTIKRYREHLKSAAMRSDI